MHNYKLLEDDNTTLLFNSCFVDIEDIEYAYNHRFNILCTETKCADIFNLISKLMKLGYAMEVVEVPQSINGIELDPKLYAKFIYPNEDNNNKDDFISQNERTIITDCLNYLIALSRLVSANEAREAYGFNWDGAILDLFIKIKNDFYDGNFNPHEIASNELYKEVITDLVNMLRTR